MNENSVDNHSTFQLFREIGDALTDLVRNELYLVKTEVKETGLRLKSHLIQAAIFSLLALVSIPPFIAFLVIGLGDLLNGRYWLSALVVSAVFAAVGGTLA